MPTPIKRPFIYFQGERYFLENNGYYRTTRTRGRRLYHRDLWTSVHGPIPDKWEIHHRDHNRDNNDISNLVALSKSAHVSSHPPRGAFGESATVKSAKRRAEWARREPRMVTCVGCGVEYESTGQRAMFCTKPCRRRWYRINRGY